MRYVDGIFGRVKLSEVDTPGMSGHAAAGTDRGVDLAGTNG
jgi:hypothetical protein